MHKILFFILILQGLNGFCQEGLNLKLNSMYASTSDAIFADEHYVYIMGNTFDTTRIAVEIGKFYKLNLETNTIEDSIDINSNPIGFDTRSTKIFNINDTLHYFTYGQEWKDTVINNQNIFTHFHHFRYSLSDGEWQNETFPAFNQIGEQFLSNTDAYISNKSIYTASVTTDFEINDADMLITKLDHNNNVKWNVEFENEIFH